MLLAIIGQQNLTTFPSTTTTTSTDIEINIDTVGKLPS